jgi:hypothetical protein
VTSSLIHTTKAEVDAVERILQDDQCDRYGEDRHEPDGYWRALAEHIVEECAEARVVSEAADHYGHLLDLALVDSRVAADQAHDAAMRQR